jgi:hypothetical protein
LASLEEATVGSVFVYSSMPAGAFRERVGFSAPSWDTMIAEMRDDPTPYDA